MILKSLLALKGGTQKKYSVRRRIADLCRVFQRQHCIQYHVALARKNSTRVSHFIYSQVHWRVKHDDDDDEIAKEVVTVKRAGSLRTFESITQRYHCWANQYKHILIYNMRMSRVLSTSSLQARTNYRYICHTARTTSTVLPRTLDPSFVQKLSVSTCDLFRGRPQYPRKINATYTAFSLWCKGWSETDTLNIYWSRLNPEIHRPFKLFRWVQRECVTSLLGVSFGDL